MALIKCVNCESIRSPKMFGKNSDVCNPCRYEKRMYKDKTLIKNDEEKFLTCLCGCGESFLTTSRNRFIIGHRKKGDNEYSVSVSFGEDNG